MKINSIKVPKNKDRRYKLSESDRKLIRLKHKKGESIHSISKMFNVSRRTIQFILFPERLEQNLKLRSERGGSKQYYDSEYHKQSMRKHRAYKKELFNSGYVSAI